MARLDGARRAAGYTGAERLKGCKETRVARERRAPSGDIPELSPTSLERYVVLAAVPKLATTSRRLLTPIFAKTDLR